jgi:hypothetical protein
MRASDVKGYRHAYTTRAAMKNYLLLCYWIPRSTCVLFFFSLSSLEIPVWQLKSLVSTLSWRYFNINTHSLDFFFLVLLYVFVLFFIFILQSTFSVFCFLYSVLVPSFFLYFYLISFINFQLFLISFFNQNI